MDPSYQPQPQQQELPTSNSPPPQSVSSIPNGPTASSPQPQNYSSGMPPPQPYNSPGSQPSQPQSMAPPSQHTSTYGPPQPAPQPVQSGTMLRGPVGPPVSKPPPIKTKGIGQQLFLAWVQTLTLIGILGILIGILAVEIAKWNKLFKMGSDWHLHISDIEDNTYQSQYYLGLIYNR